MSNPKSSLKLKIQAMLDKTKSLANILPDIKSIESKLPRIKIRSALNMAATKKELNSKLKNITQKIKVDADTSKAAQKMKKLGKQKTDAKIQPTVDNSQIKSGLKETQEETKSFFNQFLNDAIRTNLVRMGVQQVIQAISQAISGIKELDTMKTNLQMTSGLSDSKADVMMGSYNSMAKELSTTTKSISEAANELLCMGESVTSVNELVKSSQILSKTGMMESSDAANCLVSSMKGYQMAAEDSIDIVNKLTSVDMSAAVSAGGLAEAISLCADSAHQSGTSLDRLIAYAAVIGETTQESMSTIGNSLSSVYGRMNNIKAGKLTDDETGESLSDTESVLNNLGIHLRDTKDAYRDFDDILDEISKRWDGYTQAEQNALSVAIAGTAQRERFTALMDNYSSALRYSETAANSAGSALERYGVYQDSIEAKTNELTAAIESLSTSAVSENTFGGIIEATTSLVEFIDKAGLLKGTLAGLVTMGISKMFVSMATGIISAVKSTAQLTSVMAMFNNGTSTTNLNQIGEKCIGLSSHQLKLVLSTKTLDNTMRKQILTGMGVEKQNQEQTLATLGLAEAENAATVSTFSLTGAIKAFWTTFRSNPIGFIIGVFTTIITVVTTAKSIFKKNHEEALQRTEEAKSAIKEIKSDLKNLHSTTNSVKEKFAQLAQNVHALGKANQSRGKLTTDDYEEFLRISNQLAELFPQLITGYDDNGNAILNLSGNVDTIVGSLDNLVSVQEKLKRQELLNNFPDVWSGYTDDIKEYQKELANSKEVANGAATALSKLQSQKVFSVQFLDGNSDPNKAIQKALEKIGVGDSSDNWGGLYNLSGNATGKTTWDFSSLSDDELDRLKNTLGAISSEYESDVQLAKGKIETANSQMSDYMNTWLSGEWNFSQMAPNMQKAVKEILSGSDWISALPNNIDSGNWDEVSNWLQQHFLYAINNIDNETLKTSLINALNGKFTVESMQKTIDELRNTEGFEENNPLIIYLQTKLDNKEQMILSVKEKINDEFSDEELDKKIAKLSESDLQIASEQVGISDDTLLSWDELIAKVNMIKEKTSATASPSEIDTLSQVQSLSQGLSQLSKIYEDVSNKGDFDWSSILNNKDFEETFGNMTNVTSRYKDAYSEFIKTISNSPDDIDACESSFCKLAYAYIYNSDALKNVTKETRTATINILEQGGVVKAQEMVDNQLAKSENNLARAKSTQAEIYKTLSQSVSSTQDAKHLESLQSIDLENATYGEIQSLIEEADMLEISSQSLVDYSLQKMRAGDTAINTADDINNILTLAKASGIASSAISKLQGLKAQYDKFVALGNSNAAVQVMYDMQRAAADIQQEISGFQPTDIDPSGKDKTPAATSAKNTPETFNWLETLLSRLSSAFDKLKQKGEDTFLKFTARADSYKSALENVSQQIAAQQQAYDAYMAHANSVGLPAEYIDKIQNGSLSIEEISDDSLKEKIKDYQSWYEKALECGTELEKLKKTQKELAQEKMETLLTQYDKLLSRLEAKNTRTENYIDLKEVWGGSASKNNYKDMNKNILSQISNIIKQNRELKNLQNTVENTSEAWYGYGERMADNNAAIQDLTQNMAENANAAAELARQTAEKRNGKKDTADEITDTKLNTASTAGRKNLLINSKLGNIDGRQGNLKTAYDTNRKARNSYGNKILKANQKDVSKKNKKYFSKAIASVKSKSLIPASTIDGITNAMKTAEGREYQELGTLLSYCIYYNANKQAEDENKLNYEMYALTAQAEKKSLREEQLQNNLDKNQSRADRNTMSTANTASAKNHNLDAQTRLNNQNVTSYGNAATKAASDRKKAASKAKFNTDKTYKNLKNKTLKKRLASVISAIKNGKKISGDGLKAVKNYCQKYLNGNMTYYYNCEAYNEAVENELSAKDAKTLAKAEAYAANLQARIEKTENNVSGRDSENELYTAAAKNQTTAQAKNSYVDKQSSNIDKNLNDYKNSYSTLSGEYTSAKQTINKSSSKDKSKQKIITEIKSKYVSKNELIPSNYIEKAYTVSNSFGLACENYNEALEAKNSAQETYELYQQTSQTEKAALALEKMSNIDKEYSNKQSVYEQKATKINHAIDLAQAKGYQVSTTYYSKLIENEESTNQALESKRKELINSLAESMKNGSIVKYSDEWYEACASIDSVTNEIDASTLSLVEFNNQMRQVEWDNFDYLENRIRNVTSEIDFMINELSRKDLASYETGGLTDNGKAVATLHAANYETYQKQAKDYKEKISEINKSLANDPYNKTLLDRKQELIQSYQDSIKAAQDEKDAVIDLNEQGYDALLNKIKSLISEYEELMDAQKDAFDYQNTISDKTKEIANLRKQLTAYAGDTSEEARAKIQSLTVSLEEAERDLQETQYNKYISDTKSMLSDLSDNFEDAIQALIDSLSENFDSLMNDIDSNLSETAETIKEAMTGIGYIPTEEFKTILGSSEIAVSVTKMTGALEQFSLDMQKYSDEIAKSLSDKTAGEEESGAEENSTKESGTKESSGTGGTISNAASTGMKMIPLIASGTEPLRGLGEVNLPNSAISGKRLALEDEALNFLNANLKKTTKRRSELSDLNKKLYDGFGKVLTTAKIKELAKILGVRYDNNKSTGTVYKKLKELGIKGFKTGSWNIPYDQLAFLGEGSYELQFDKSEGVLRKVGQGDIILDANASKNLLQLLNADPEQLIGNINIPVPAPAPNFSSITENRSTGDVKIDMGGIVMNGVNDPKEFTSNLITAINTNAAVKKVMLNHTIGTLSNEYNSLSGRQFTP